MRIVAPHIDYFSRRRYFLRNEFFPGCKTVYYRLNEYVVYCPDANHYAALYDEIIKRDVYRVGSGLNNVIDAGANVGIFVLKVKTLNPDCRLTCFEPVPSTRNILIINVLKNNLSDVLIYPFALSGDNGSIEISDGADCGANSKFINEGERVVNVEARKLSDFITEDVDLLKIDIEGGEYDVFKDLCDTGKIKSIKRIVCEVHYTNKMDFPRLLSSIMDNGFTVRITYTFGYVNDLFIFEAVRNAR
jgi:FkbM family methyltransferase